jgi:hypothetical protein
MSPIMGTLQIFHLMRLRYWSWKEKEYVCDVS